MATFADLAASLLQAVEIRLEYKEAALRYCNHSKKRDKLIHEVKHLRVIADNYRKYAKKKEDAE